jgi:hypothetical protein
MNKNLEINVKETKEFITHIINNNRYLQEKNKPPVSVEVKGESGIGKTSTIIQIANEIGLDFVKLNLAQIEELGDLVGFPIRQFELSKDKDTIWVDEHSVSEYVKTGYSFTKNNRTSYCPPEWISNKKEGGILLLDDWNRADVRFIQAVMELIDRQQYISWKLPKDWHIILTSNPDNGEYMVNSVDDAQETRYISIGLKFDLRCWGEWAENNEIDSRCINFLLMHPELVSKKANSRSITTFFNSISSIKSFENNLPLINMIGEGSVGPEFASLFSMFINNKLDKIISPEIIMSHESEDYICNTLKSIISNKNNYRADLASLIATRIINYSVYYSQNNKIGKEYINRLTNIINNEDIFAIDLKYNIVKSIYNSNVSAFKEIMLNKILVQYLMK